MMTTYSEKRVRLAKNFSRALAQDVYAPENRNRVQRLALLGRRAFARKILNDAESSDPEIFRNVRQAVVKYATGRSGLGWVDVVLAPLIEVGANIGAQFATAGIEKDLAKAQAEAQTKVLETQARLQKEAAITAAQLRAQQAALEAEAAVRIPGWAWVLGGTVLAGLGIYLLTRTRKN